MCLQMAPVWYGGDHVRFLGLGHTLMMVVDSAILLFSVRHDKSKSSCKNISDMVDSCCVIVVDHALCLRLCCTA